MAGGFRHAISRLFRSIGLREPSLGERRSTVLNVGGIDIVLSESEDGEHVVVKATVGNLSPLHDVRTRQIELILTSTLGNLAANAACIGLNAADDRPEEVVVCGTVCCDDAGIRRLPNLVADVASTVEMLRPEFVGGKTRKRKPPAATAHGMEFMIFQP